MRDKLTDAIRAGIVSSIDPDKGTAKVTFEDRNGIVSRDLPLNFAKALHDYDYCMPDVGERVRCFFDPEAPSRGYILGSFPADTREPPIKNKDKRYTLFKDGTLIEYDRALHKLTIKIPSGGAKSINIFAESDIDITTNGKINIKAAKDINVETAENINITAAKTLNVKTAEQITVDSGSSIDIGAVEQINITSDKPIYVKSSEYVQLQGAETTLTVP